jgi:hypothetical protein
MTYEPRTAPPLPKGPVEHRPVTRSESPFAAIRRNTTPEGNYAYDTERQRIKAQRDARKVLDELDARRRGIQRDETNAARRGQDPTAPRERKRRRVRPTSLVLPDERLLQLFDEGFTCLQIERMTGVSQRTVRTRAHELGVHHPPVSRHTIEHPEITAEGMIALRDQGVGWRGIADHYGVSYATIRRYRDREGVDPQKKGTTAA